MNRKYKLHPGRYEIGENEKFYGDMEAKGWRLVERGAYFSRFQPVEPSNARYRIEVFQCSPWSTEGMSEEQLGVFEDCGWEHVCTSLPLYIFRAPAGSGAPEFYVNPAQQALTLKKMKRDVIWGWVPNVVAWGLCLLLYLALNGASKVAADVQGRMVTFPPMFLLAAVLLLQGLYIRGRNAWIITRTYRRMKKGISLDHAPSRSRWVHLVVNGTLLTLLLICTLLMTVQLITTRSTDLPEETAVPYLLLSDLGWEGERTSFMNKDSGVTHTCSLLADYWDTVEYMEAYSGGDPQMYQDVYCLRFPAMANWLADALMRSANFGDGGRNFAPVESDGVDAAWASRLEVVAVKGPYVAYVTYLPDTQRDFDPQALCAALAEKWTARGSTE